MKAVQAEKKFRDMSDAMRASGYIEKAATISQTRAMLVGLLCALLFAAAFGAVYRLALIDRAHLSYTGGLYFYAMFAGIIIASAFAHELLHGLGWAIASGKGWGAVRFNISAMMPSCACTAPLGRGQYIAGVLAPFVLLGSGSVVFMFVYPGTASVLTMLVNFLLAGADLLIAFKALRERGALIVDHPTQAGYVAFYGRESVKE